MNNFMPHSLDNLFTTIDRLAENSIWTEKANLSGTRYSIQGIKFEFAEIIIEPIANKLYVYKTSHKSSKELKQIRSYKTLDELIAVLKETYLEDSNAPIN